MPPTKKRAAPSDEAHVEETPKKRTKKEARELALKRARESMQADKLKVEAVKAKKQQQQQQQAGSEKDDSSKVTSTPLKRPKIAEKKPASKPAEPATAKSATAAKPTPKAEATKKTQPKSNDETKNPPNPAPAQQPQQFVYPQMQGEYQPGYPVNPATMGYGTANYYGMPPGAPTAPSGVNAAMMAEFMRGQQPRTMTNPYYMAQQPFPGGYGGHPPPQNVPQNNFAMQQESAQQVTLQQNTTNEASQQKQEKPESKPKESATPNFVPPTGDRTISPASPPKKTATAIPDSDDDDDDEAMPPPPTSTLELQISQQVMANVAALQNNEPTPFNVPPPEAFTSVSSAQLDDDGDEEVYDDQPIIVDDEDVTPLVKKRQTWGKGIASAIIVALLSYFIMMDGDSADELLPVQSPGTIDSPEASCYYDTVVLDSEDYVPACRDQEGAPCPEGGICEGGKLVACQYWFEEVSNDGKGCVLPTEKQKRLETIKDVLKEKSVASKCSFLSSNGQPMFDYTQVQLAKPMELATNPLELAVLEKELVSERRNGKFFIGLPDHQSLDLPFSCRAVVSLKTFIRNCGSLIILMVHKLLSWIWLACRAYPLYSLVGFIAVYLLRKRRQYQSYRSKLLRDIAQVRQMAYEILQDRANTSHVVLHVRDEIAMALFPDSKSQRQYLIKDVWPRIIPDFAQDNRVRKSTRVIEGRPRDVWQWVASTSAKKPEVKTTSEQ